MHGRGRVEQLQERSHPHARQEQPHPRQHPAILQLLDRAYQSVAVLSSLQPACASTAPQAYDSDLHSLLSPPLPALEPVQGHPTSRHGHDPCHANQGHHVCRQVCRHVGAGGEGWHPH